MQAAKPKEAESLKIPTMIRHRRENRPTTKGFFSKRFAAAAQGQDLTATDEYENAIATADVNKLNKIFNTAVKFAPNMADQVYQGILKKLEDPKSQEEFIAKNEEMNSRLKTALADVNNPTFVKRVLPAPYMFWGPYADVKAHPPTEWANFYRRYVPLLNDKNLLWLSRFLAENINYKAYENYPDSTPEEREENSKIEAMVSRYEPLRHYVINYLHKQVKDRNLMTSLISRMNDPEALEQFVKSTEEANAGFARSEKFMKRQNASQQS